MFIAAPSTIAKTCKQPKCPSTEEWIKKMWYIDICVCVLVTQLCLTLCNSMNCSPPRSMGFSRQEYWTGLPGPSPGDLPDPGIEPGSPALQADSLPSEPPGKPIKIDR